MPAQPPKLLDQVRAALRARRYPAHAEEATIAWITRRVPGLLGHKDVKTTMPLRQAQGKSTLTSSSAAAVRPSSRRSLAIRSPLD
jgi:hypothetical protein